MPHAPRSLAPALVLGFAIPLPATAQHPVRVSVSSAGEQANSDSFSPSVSADGRYVAFSSFASNLVAGDTNRCCDVFVRDVASGTTSRVSVATGGAQGDDASGVWSPFDMRRVVDISADGSRVAFISIATNFAPGVGPWTPQVYVHDRTTGTTSIASRTPAGSASNAGVNRTVISGDGRWVFFASASSDLASGAVDGRTDLYTLDLATSTVVRVHAPEIAGASSAYVDWFASSSDGRHVVLDRVANFQSPTGTGYRLDIVVVDRDADGNGLFDEPGAGTRSTVIATYDDAFTSTPDVGADGRFVVYQQRTGEVIRHDRDSDADGVLDESGATESRVVAHNEADLTSWPYEVAIGSGGRWVGSWERVAGRVTYEPQQLFLRDVERGADHLATRSPAGSPQTGSTRTGTVALTPDAAFVAFESAAANLVSGDTNGFTDVFVKARPDGLSPGDATRYCESGPNSTGASARIGFAGTTSVSANDLVLRAYDCTFEGGAFFYGPAATRRPFGNGTLCVGAGAAQLYRLPPAGADFVGYPAFAFTAAPGGPIAPGSSWYFQYRFRDVAAGGAQFDLSDGLKLVFGP